MSRRVPILFALAAFLAPGCVPTTEPVGDVEKAEPDKGLVGTWAEVGTPEKAVLRITAAPDVKGNPKGLMVMTFLDPEAKKEQPIWFFVTTIDKEHYGNLLMDVIDEKEGVARLGNEGEYAKWSKGAGRRYLVFRYATGKDGVVMNFGDSTAVGKVMENEKITRDDKNCYKTPAGWLAKYLEKNGRESLFPAKEDSKLVKVKQ